MGFGLKLCETRSEDELSEVGISWIGLSSEEKVNLWLDHKKDEYFDEASQKPKIWE